MKATQENKKVGKRKCWVVNRLVGKTCSTNCPMKKRCYAKKTEQRWKSAELVSAQNQFVSVSEWVELFNLCNRQNKPLRLHERGDFGTGIGDKLDKPYLDNLRIALKQPHPNIWLFTHLHKPQIAQLPIITYASVESASSIKQAESAGFKRFALVLPFRPKISRPYLRGLPVYQGNRWITLHDKKWFVCPAVYQGKRKHKPTCVECKHCILGKSNVAFPMH